MQDSNPKSNYHTVINSHNEKYLKPEDVYALIKHFSFTIQQRLEEIEKTNSIYTCLNSFNSEKSDLQNYLIRRYDQYKTTDPIEIKLLDRLCERVIQIFLFYKQKCYQPENFINMQQKIQCKLRQLMQTTKSYQYFPNARPKTQKIHIHLKQSKNNFSNKNDQTLYLRSTNSNNLNDIILNEEVINLQRNKSSQISDKNKEVQVGNLFRYIFTILKKGYLLRLKLEKRKHEKINANNTTCNPLWNSSFNTKAINQNKPQEKRIHIQGIQAPIRAISSSENTAKGNGKNSSKNMFQFQNNNILLKPTQNSQHQKPSFHINDFNRRKTSASQFAKKLKQQKQFNNFTFSNQTNNYKYLKDNKQKQKETALNTREVQKCLSYLYLDVLSDVQKYPLLRQIKNQEIFLKQSIKKNQFSFNQIKKYSQGYNKKYHPIVQTPAIPNPGIVTMVSNISNNNCLETMQNLQQQLIQQQNCYTQIKSQEENLRNFKLKSKTQTQDNQKNQKIQGQSINLLALKQKTISVQQKELLIFLKKENKINRLSCLEKSSNKKRKVLQNNQNRMNISLNATMIQRMSSQKKRHNLNLFQKDNKKNPEENAIQQDQKIKINRLFNAGQNQNQNFIDQDLINVNVNDEQNQIKNQRADIFFPIPTLQTFVNQTQIALKQTSNIKEHHKNSRNQQRQQLSISIQNPLKVIKNDQSYMNLKHKNKSKYKIKQKKTKAENMSAYENRLYEQQQNDEYLQIQKQKLLCENLPQKYHNLDLEMSLCQRILSKRKKQEQKRLKQVKTNVNNSRKQNTYNGVFRPSKILNMNFGL